MSTAQGTTRLFICDANDESVRARYEALKDETYRAQLGLDPFLEEDFESYKKKYMAYDRRLMKTMKLKSAPEVSIGDMVLRAPATSQNRSLDFAFGIYPDFQGQGYGREALEWLVHKTFEIDAGKWMTLRLETQDWNIRAKALYSKVGFTECGRLSNYSFQDGKYSDEICMEMTRAQYEVTYGVANGETSQCHD